MSAPIVSSVMGCPCERSSSTSAAVTSGDSVMFTVVANGPLTGHPLEKILDREQVNDPPLFAPPVVVVNHVL